MTRWIIWLSGFLVIVGAIVLTIVLALSARLPDRTPWPDVGFRACKLPCWSSITPGQTPFDQVVPLLSTTLPSDSRLLVSGSQVDFWTQNSGRPFYGYLYYTAGSVGNVSMHVELTVGQVMRRIGTPDCVYLETIDTGEHLIAAYWETPTGMVGVLVPMTGDVWGPRSQTTTLFLGQPQPACDREAVSAWRGFVPFSRYQALAGES